MDQAGFYELQHTFTDQGPAAAIERLCATLRETKDYGALFYALLLKKRYELGVSPVPTGPAQDLPEEVHVPYEDAIRDAGRLVGRLYLEQGDIPHAWVYFRMLGESQPVAEALDKFCPAEGDDIQPLVDIGYYQGVHPRKAFDLVLERSGICSAITMVSGQEFPHGPEAREYCIKRLVRTLYAELYERLKADVVHREGKEPAEKTVRELMAGHEVIFEEGFYHIDISHLGAVVQMSMHLPPGEDLDMAREVCAYGQRLSPRFQHPGEPPFEDQYHDYAVYLAALAGERTEVSLDHFRRKAQTADPEEAGTMPAEVLVNLLLRLDRPAEALAVARRHLATTEDRQLTCPGIAELCQRTHDYQALAEVAREQGDPVHFMAGLIAGKQANSA